MTRHLHPALREYLTRVKALSGAYTPSLFWERQLADFRRSPSFAELDHLGVDEVEAMIRRLGYGFEDLPPQARSVNDDPEFTQVLETTKRVHREMKRFTPEAWRLTKDKWEHVRALDFLASQGLLDEYVAFLAPLRVRSSMSVARHFFYARLIVQLVRQHGDGAPIDVLEIGAGAGNLAVFLAAFGAVRSYCIVDLPEMLVNSGYTIAKCNTQARVIFGVPQGRDDLTAGSYWFIPPQLSMQLPDSVFGLCLNFNSFMEMDRDVRDEYFTLIYRTAATQALFINVNRRQRALPQRDGSVFDNNPLLYPYRPDDWVLRWEEEEFQQTTRSQWGKIPSLAVLRACIINRDPPGPRSATPQAP